MQVKVDRVNRLGKDVCNILDGPSQKAVKGELQEFNDRWRDDFCVCVKRQFSVGMQDLPKFFNNQSRLTHTFVLIDSMQ